MLSFAEKVRILAKSATPRSGQIAYHIQSIVAGECRHDVMFSQSPNVDRLRSFALASLREWGAGPVTIVREIESSCVGTMVFRGEDNVVYRVDWRAGK